MKNIFLILAVLLLTACQTTKVNYLNTTELQTNYPRVMAFNPRMEPGLEMHKTTLRTYIEPKIKATLQAKGFEFVSSERFYEIHSQLRDAEPNLFDPLTGQRDEVRSNEIWQKALQQAKSELNIDAFVYYGLVVRKAFFSNNLINMYVASWDGQEEPALADGVGAGKVLGSFFVQTNGSLPGLSVFVSFEDEFDQTMSFGAGGIELLAQFNNDKDVVYKSFETLLQNRQQIDTAIERAFSQIDNYKKKQK